MVAVPGHSPRYGAAPKPRDGGRPGAAGRVSLGVSGRTLRPKGQQTIPPADRLRLEMPGGGVKGAGCEQRGLRKCKVY